MEPLNRVEFPTIDPIIPPRKMTMSRHSKRGTLPYGSNIKPTFLAFPEFKDDSSYARFKQEAKLAFRMVNLKHMIDPTYIVVNQELHTAQAEWCFCMAQICWTNDVAHTILNQYEDSNDFCGAWQEITGYFDKAMTTKLKRIRLQGSSPQSDSTMLCMNGREHGLASLPMSSSKFASTRTYANLSLTSTVIPNSSLSWMPSSIRPKASAKFSSRTSRPTRQPGKDPRISFKEFVEQLTEHAKIYNATCKKTRSQTCRASQGIKSSSDVYLHDFGNHDYGILDPCESNEHNMYTLIDDVMSLEGNFCTVESL
jgi:hypothetical protein